MWPTWPAVAPEGFSGRFGRGSDEVTEGVRTWVIFVLCFGMGLLHFGCKKWPNMEGKGMSGMESRRM